MKKWLFHLSVLTFMLSLPNLIALPFKLLSNTPVAGFFNSAKVENEWLIYKGNGYAIDIPANWTTKKISENQILFTGPKVGNANVGFYITKLPKEDKSYLVAANKTKQQQSTYDNYRIIEEKDISQPGFKAFMRRAHWFKKDINMELFVREIFTETDANVFILSASIPNTPKLQQLDKAIISMMSSFRFASTSRKTRRTLIKIKDYK